MLLMYLLFVVHHKCRDDVYIIQQHYVTNEGQTGKYFDIAKQRVSTSKSYSKLGVVTKSTLTETADGIRKSTRSTTLSPSGKLKGIGQVVIQETKPLEAAGKAYYPQKGPNKMQGGKGGGKGKYTTKSITYAKEGYPTPKRGRIPKGGNPVISSKTASGYVSLASPQSRLGQYVQSKSSAQLLSAATKVGKGAAKVIGGANIVGTAILAYDAMKWDRDWET